MIKFINIVILMCSWLLLSGYSNSTIDRLHTLNSPPNTPDIYVSTIGDDNNDCLSSYSPCLTISGAQTRLRPLLKNNGQNRPWIVQIAGGTYHLYRTRLFNIDQFLYADPLSFQAADSGGSTINRVTWQGAPGETVVISGGYDVNSWADQGNGTWKSSAVTELQNGTFFNPRTAWAGNQPRYLPRYPSLTTYGALGSKAGVGGAPVNTSNQFTTTTDISGTLGASPSDLQDWTFWGLQTWSATRLNVIGMSSNGSTSTLTTSGWTLSAYNTFDSNAAYFIEGVGSLITNTAQTGTYYVNRVPSNNGTGNFTGTILYHPISTETDPTNFTLTFPVMKQIMTVSNTTDGSSLVKHLTFKNIEFAYASNPGVPVQDKSGTQGGAAMGASIGVAGADDIIFDGDTFRNMGSLAISFHKATSNCKVINSVFYDLGGGAIQATSVLESQPDLNGGGVVSNAAPENLIPNPTFDYANSTNPTTGAPVVMGATWTGSAVQNGLTATRIASGVTDGLAYVDVHFTGTPTSINGFSFNAGPAKPIPVSSELQGTTYIQQVPTGTDATSNVNKIVFDAHIFRDNSNLIQNVYNQSNLSYTIGTITKSNVTGLHSATKGSTITLTDTRTEQVQPYIALIPNNTTIAIDVTIRFGQSLLVNNTYWKRTIASTTSPSLLITNHEIANNVIRNWAQYRIDSSAILVNDVQGIDIHNNDAKNGYSNFGMFGYVTANDRTLNCTGTAGSRSCTISLINNSTYPFASNIKVHHNISVDTSGGVMSDLGIIHSGGNVPGMEMYQNILANNHCRKGPCAGIYNDQGASNYNVYKNTIIGTDTACLFHNPGINNSYYNNICRNVDRYGATSGEWVGTLFSMGAILGNPNDWTPRDTITNIGDNVSCNVSEWIGLTSDPSFPRLIGSWANWNGVSVPDSWSNIYTGYSQYDNNLYHRVTPTGGNITGIPTNVTNGTAVTWAIWQTNGHDVHSTWTPPNWTGTYPKFYPGTKPPNNCWINFNQDDTGLTDPSLLNKVPTSFPTAYQQITPAVPDPY